MTSISSFPTVCLFCLLILQICSIFLIFFTRWVVTAAHCLSSGRDLEVYFGVDQTGRFIGKLQVNSANQFIFPGYDPSTHVNDIGLYELLHLHLGKILKSHFQILQDYLNCRNLFQEIINMFVP